MGSFGTPLSMARNPKFWTSIFKSGSENTWQGLVQHRSVTSEDGVRKKRKKKKNPRAKYNSSENLMCSLFAKQATDDIQKMFLKYDDSIRSS